MERDADPAVAFFPGESKPDLYAALGLKSNCTSLEIKSAYRKSALIYHPDKLAQTATEEEKELSNTKFQQIGFSYGILKDEVKRKRFDETGRTDDVMGGKTEQGWRDYFATLWTGEVNAKTVEEFTKNYQGSEEEKSDLFDCYTASSGSLETILSSIMCSTYEDEDRFIKLINSAITAKTLTSFPAWKKAIKDSKAQEKRKSKAVREAGEAEAYAKEMGVHDKLFSKKGKGKGKATQEEEEASLKALIQGNQVKRMDSIIGSIEAKYVNQESNRKKKRNSEEGGDGNKKQKTEIEPSEEEFLKLQKEMDARRKSSGNGEEKKKGKKGRGSL